MGYFLSVEHTLRGTTAMSLVFIDYMAWVGRQNGLE